jgi:hypothetical protein
MHHRDLSDFFAPLLLSAKLLPVLAHFRVLTM